jgi:hypothetical protein
MISWIGMRYNKADSRFEQKIPTDINLTLQSELDLMMADAE